MSSNILVKRVCEFCGKNFLAKTTVTRFCTHACNRRNLKQAVTKTKIIQSDLQVKQLMIGTEATKIALEFLTVRQAAKLLGTTERHVYKMIQNGRLPARKLTERKTIIPRKDIDDLFDQPETLFTPSTVKSRLPALIYCYSMQQAQDHFKMSAKALSELIKRNELTTFQQGHYVYVLKTALNEIFNQNL